MVMMLITLITDIHIKKILLILMMLIMIKVRKYIDNNEMMIKNKNINENSGNTKINSDTNMIENKQSRK